MYNIAYAIHVLSLRSKALIIIIIVVVVYRGPVADARVSNAVVLFASSRGEFSES